MKSCKSKLKHNCGTISYGVCTRYEGDVSENSSLTPGCLNLEDTTQDIYEQLDVIDEKIDMSSLSSSCLPAITNPTLILVLNQLRSEICTLKTTVTTQATQIATLQGQVAQLQENPCS